MVAGGVIVFFCVSSILPVPKFNIIQIIGAGLIPAFCELLVIRRLPEGGRRLLLVDGAMFPFFSAGLCVGMIVV
jgi:hypothetical protein